MDYDRARTALETGSREAQLILAKRPDTPPEILYYLAEQGDADARAAVAGNTRTPQQANQLLAEDEQDEVRAELGRKIVRIMPDLTDPELAHVREATIAIMEKLAQDQAAVVRQRLAEEIHQSGLVPPHLAKTLAADDLEEISCPILQYSPLLSDEDLRELIAAGLSATRLGAVAQRPEVSEQVADDIAATLEVPAIAALLTNPKAHIREDTMDKIVEQAKETSMLHGPLVHRPDLSMRVMQRLTTFVARPLVDTMVAKHNLPEDMKRKLLDRVKGPDSATRKIDETDDDKLADLAHSMRKRNAIEDDTILSAVKSNRRKLAMHYLAALADLPFDVVRKMIQAREAKPVIAICYRAGLSMRTAYQLQSQLAMIPPSDLIPARNGKDYPLSIPEMEIQIGLFHNG